MIGRGELERVLTLRVRTIDGETEHVPVRLRVGVDGAVLRVFAPPNPDRHPRRLAALRLVEAVDAALRRPGAPGLALLQREAEAMAALLEDLLEAEAAGARLLAVEAGR
jgi:hypothetical protein